MKFIGSAQIKSLSEFKSGDFPKTSFYLDTDKSRLSKKEIALNLKHLLNEGKSKLEAMDLDKDKKDSLAADLDGIASFCAEKLGSFNHAGLSLFSCSTKNFRQPLYLPHGPRNRIVYDLNFYVRPLLAILDKYRRICVFLINRREARWYEVSMEEITPLESITGKVPGQVKGGGYEGNESKRIERHIEALLQDHFKKASQLTFDLFKKSHFDWLFLGCEDDSYPVLEPFLHTYVKDRLKGRLKAKPAEAPAKILKEAMELETRFNANEESEIVQKLIAELERGGRACSGLRETLQRLNLFEVQSLVVTHSFSKEGRVCPRCRFLYLEELICPACQIKTNPVVDVIDEALESAIKRHASVKQISPPCKLDRYGKIGAFLKYKI